jgi:hypothetical protein
VVLIWIVRARLVGVHSFWWFCRQIWTVRPSPTTVRLVATDSPSFSGGQPVLRGADQPKSLVLEGLFAFMGFNLTGIIVV